MTPTTRTASIMNYLQVDHARLDGLMNDAKTVLASGDAEGAAAFFHQFRKGLLRHIQIEEEILFPAFEAITGIEQQGPTGVMREEHMKIKRQMDQIHGLFESGGPETSRFEALRSSLVALLHEHNVKEENVLYPMCDRLIEEDRRRAMIARMETY